MSDRFPWATCFTYTPKSINAVQGLVLRFWYDFVFSIAPSLCSPSTLPGVHAFQPRRSNVGCVGVLAISSSSKNQQGDICISTGYALP